MTTDPGAIERLERALLDVRDGIRAHRTEVRAEFADHREQHDNEAARQTAFLVQIQRDLATLMEKTLAMEKAQLAARHDERLDALERGHERLSVQLSLRSWAGVFGWLTALIAPWLGPHKSP